jgi:hypothetical protein
MLNTIFKQNYFQYDGHVFQPKRGIAMGSPISSTMAETYLQYLEEIYKTLVRQYRNNVLQKIC